MTAYCPKAKRSYATQEAAEQALGAYRSMRKRVRLSSRRAYACPWCGYWHLTSKPVDTEASA